MSWECAAPPRKLIEPWAGLGGFTHYGPILVLSHRCHLHHQPLETCAWIASLIEHGTWSEEGGPDDWQPARNQWDWGMLWLNAAGHITGFNHWQDYELCLCTTGSPGPWGRLLALSPLVWLSINPVESTRVWLHKQASNWDGGSRWKCKHGSLYWLCNQQFVRSAWVNSMTVCPLFPHLRSLPHCAGPTHAGIWCLPPFACGVSHVMSLLSQNYLVMWAWARPSP